MQHAALLQRRHYTLTLLHSETYARADLCTCQMSVLQGQPYAPNFPSIPNLLDLVTSMTPISAVLHYLLAALNKTSSLVAILEIINLTAKSPQAYDLVHTNQASKQLCYMFPLTSFGAWVCILTTIQLEQISSSCANTALKQAISFAMTSATNQKTYALVVIDEQAFQSSKSYNYQQLATINPSQTQQQVNSSHLEVIICVGTIFKTALVQVRSIAQLVACARQLFITLVNYNFQFELRQSFAVQQETNLPQQSNSACYKIITQDVELQNVKHFEVLFVTNLIPIQVFFPPQ